MSDAGPPIAVLGDVNARIDKCVRDASGLELALWILLSLMMVVGLFALVWGVLRGNHYLVSASVGATGLNTWPAVRLIQLHRRRVALSVVPAITALLTPKDAAREIHSLIRVLLDKN